MLKMIFRTLTFFVFMFSYLASMSLASQVNYEIEESFLNEAKESPLIQSKGDIFIDNDIEVEGDLLIQSKGDIFINSSVKAGGNLVIHTDGNLVNRGFIFVRHGHTPWGRDDILKGPLDLELDKTGIKQAAQAATYLSKNFTFENPVIVTSPLARARQTAKHIYEKLGTPPLEEENDLKERYYGDYTKADPTNIKAYKPADAESDQVFRKRVIQALNHILRSYSSSYSEIILVSHQKVFQFLAQWLANQEDISLDQGGICHFEPNNLNQGYSLQVCK